jgi:hypothetical protein
MNPLQQVHCEMKELVFDVFEEIRKRNPQKDLEYFLLFPKSLFNKT